MCVGVRVFSSKRGPAVTEAVTCRCRLMRVWVRVLRIAFLDCMVDGGGQGGQ